MTDYVPVNRNGSQPFTSAASATITGGQVLIWSGVNTVGPAGAASGLFAGVAAADAASGARVTIWPIPGVIHETVNGNAGTITAGNPITTGAAGTVDTGTLATVAAAGTLMGTAVTTAVTTAKVQWMGR